MFGNNPKRGPINGDGSKLYIHSIFRTLQGEAVYAGVPSIFIRCGGCNLACSFCDTEFENYSEIHIDDILSQVDILSKQVAMDQGGDKDMITDLDSEGVNSARVINLIVITGGEPLRQPIELLCEKLLSLGYLVQIETNGVLFRPLPIGVEVVCSPKVVSGKYLSINPLLKPYIIALKFLLSTKREGYDKIPKIEFETNRPLIFVQAMDEYDEEINQANQEFAISYALNYGYRLSYQLHKALSIE